MQNQQKISTKKQQRVSGQQFPSIKTIPKLVPQPNIRIHLIDPIPSYAQQVKRMLESDSKELKLTHQLQQSQRKCEYMNNQLKAMERKLQEVVTQLIYMKKKEAQYRSRICRIQELLKCNNLLYKSPSKSKNSKDQKDAMIEKSPQNRFNMVNNKYTFAVSSNHQYANYNIIQYQQKKKEANLNLIPANILNSNNHSNKYITQIQQQNKELNYRLQNAFIRIKEMQVENQKLQLSQFEINNQYSQYKIATEQKLQQQRKFTKQQIQEKNKLKQQNHGLGEKLVLANLQCSQVNQILKCKINTISEYQNEIQQYEKQLNLKYSRIKRLQCQRAAIKDYVSSLPYMDQNDSIEYIESFHIVENNFQVQQEEDCCHNSNHSFNEVESNYELLQLIKKKITDFKHNQKLSFQQNRKIFLKEYGKIQEDLETKQDLIIGLQLKNQEQNRKYEQMKTQYEIQIKNKNIQCEKYQMERQTKKQEYAVLEQTILKMSKELKQKEIQQIKQCESYENKFRELQERIHTLMDYNQQLQNKLVITQQKNTYLGLQCKQLKKEAQINSLETKLFIQQLQEQKFNLKMQYDDVRKEENRQRQKLLQRLALLNEKVGEADLYINNQIKLKDKKIQDLENSLTDNKQNMTKLLQNMQNALLQNNTLKIELSKLSVEKEQHIMEIEDYKNKLLQQQIKEKALMEMLKQTQDKLVQCKQEKKYIEQESERELQKLKNHFHKEITCLEQNFKNSIDKHQLDSQKRVEDYCQNLRLNQQKHYLDWSAELQRHQSEKNEQSLLIVKYREDNQRLGTQLFQVYKNLQQKQKQKQQLNVMIQSIKAEKNDQFIRNSQIESDLRNQYEQEIRSLKSQNTMLRDIYTKFAGLIVEGCTIKKQFEDSEKSSLKNDENGSEKKTLKCSVGSQEKQNFNHANNVGVSQTQSKILIRVDKISVNKSETKKQKALV